MAHIEKTADEAKVRDPKQVPHDNNPDNTDESTMPDSGTRTRNWAFTWNNYPADHKSTLDGYVSKGMIRAAGWQQEVAPTTGTPHLQGWIVTSGLKSFKQMKDLLPKEIRISQMRKSLERNIAYCSKVRTRDGAYIEIGDVPQSQKQKGASGHLGGNAGAEYVSTHGHVWSHMIDDVKAGMSFKELVMKYPDMHGMYPRGFKEKFDMFAPPAKFDLKEKYGKLFAWQEELLAIVGKDADPRSVHWIWSPEGKVGKSDMLKHLVATQGFQPMQNGTTKDLACAWQRGNVAFDYSRDELSSGAINYTIIEHMKNGLVFSPKYESVTKTTEDFKPIFVICFANQPPDTTKLSSDRWEIYRINGERKDWTKA